MDTTFFGICRFLQFYLIDATDRSKISSDRKRFFIALSQYPLSFIANTSFKYKYVDIGFGPIDRAYFDIYLFRKRTQFELI